ncbi:glycosyltransferase [Georgenia satyanarayanai]|uniref:glycosyltransferase family 2 protein n=1 Tax=Georgenia satyanarayanai TaxID=860221 RepID=UPI00204177DD|nr:glycosyltransferase [Georgenia satyanarayanai]MCM3661072.1 glycosyltransferase [Georgenia satyanarayanai]
MSRPVDVVIAVHSPNRPVGRAVASVLDGNRSAARLTVVCHNLPTDDIAAVIDPRYHDDVRFLEHRDSHRSASGPFNAGMRAADGDFVSIMGSDDVLQPGAVRSWLDVAERTGAETVMCRLRIGSPPRRVRTPPVRPWLRGRADPVRDRLSYRSAPLGIVSQQARDRLGLELVEGMVVGGDVAYVTRLWFETRVAVDRRGPAYVIGEDARDRVTYTPRPIPLELAFVRDLLAQPWFRGYDGAARRSVCIKLTRIHLFGAVYNRRNPAMWNAEDRRALAVVARELLTAAMGFERVLSLADVALLNAILDPESDTGHLIRLSEQRRRHGHPRTLLTRSPADLLRTESPARLMAASALLG